MTTARVECRPSSPCCEVRFDQSTTPTVRIPARPRWDDRVYRFDPDVVVPVLGIVEIAVGSLLVVNRLVRVALATFAGQMVGTFLVFLILPDVVFRDGDPLLLTVEGEFVIKNLVLIAGAMVVGSRVRPIRVRPSPS